LNEIEKISELERHIAQFPHEFDKTSIGLQLKFEKVSVQVYAEIRDALFIQLRDVRAELRETKKILRNIVHELDDLL
jgi:hypothetical protein